MKIKELSGMSSKLYASVAAGCSCSCSCSCSCCCSNDSEGDTTVIVNT